MKRIHNYILLLTVCLLIACNDSFLERYPIETQTEVTAFKTYDNFKTYAWSFYGVFTQDANFVRAIDDEFCRYQGDWRAGYMATKSTTEDNPYRNNTAIAPSSGNGWSFSFVRKVNLMLDNIERSEMNDAEKAHWRSVGYFFHAFNYMELVSRFGDVPWITRS